MTLNAFAVPLYQKCQCCLFCFFFFKQEKIALGAPKRHKLSVHVISDVPRPDSAVNGEANGTLNSEDSKGEDGLMPAPILPLVSILNTVSPA